MRLETIVIPSKVVNSHLSYLLVRFKNYFIFAINLLLQLTGDIHHTKWKQNPVVYALSILREHRLCSKEGLKLKELVSLPQFQWLKYLRIDYTAVCTLVFLLAYISYQQSKFILRPFQPL